MKNFLAKKWLGPIIILLYSLVLSLYVSHQITPYLKEAFPIVAQEANDFLPITIQNGEITQPVDTVIQKDYTLENEKFHVILDTRTDKLDINTLPGNGIFISKKCFYFVSPKETKMECMEPAETAEALVITEDLVKEWLDTAEKYIGTFLNTVLILSLLIFLYVAILFYTVLMHWVVTLVYKTSFGQTLFVNTLTYVGLDIIEMMTPFSIGFWLRVVVFILVNLMICKNANERKAQTNS